MTQEERIIYLQIEKIDNLDQKDHSTLIQENR